MKHDDLMTGLPGEALVRRGLADVRSGHDSIAACLVHIARPRLSRAGLLPGNINQTFTEPEIRLYQLLKQESGDAYSRYNALLRELISFEMALDRRIRTA